MFFKDFWQGFVITDIGFYKGTPFHGFSMAG